MARMRHRPSQRSFKRCNASWTSPREDWQSTISANGYGVRTWLDDISNIRQYGGVVDKALAAQEPTMEKIWGAQRWAQFKTQSAKQAAPIVNLACQKRLTKYGLKAPCAKMLTGTDNQIAYAETVLHGAERYAFVLSYEAWQAERK
jgi:hypothetical protein